MAVPYFGRYPPSVAAEGGGITEITMTPPLASTGGATPTHSISAASAEAPGSMSAADKAFLDTLPVTGELQKFTDSAPGLQLPQSIVFTGSSYATEGTVQFWPNADLVANATNYATFNVYSQDGNGGSLSLEGTVNTTVTSLTAFTPITLASIDLPATFIVTVEIVKTLAGVEVPSGKFVYYGLRS